MESKVQNYGRKNYPCLMEQDSSAVDGDSYEPKRFVVLFTSESCGYIVWVNPKFVGTDGNYQIGAYHNGFDDILFSPYEGKIVLKNSKDNNSYPYLKQLYSSPALSVRPLFIVLFVSANRCIIVWERDSNDEIGIGKDWDETRLLPFDGSVVLSNGFKSRIE